jgi:flagellar biosynthetic protein FlhB
MAGSGSSQGDRTEKPTAKRKRDARGRGQVARSRDLASAMSLVAVTMALGWLGAKMVGLIGNRLVASLNNLATDAHATMTSATLAGTIWSDLGLLAAVAGPPAAIAGVVSIGASLAQTGFALSPKALKLNWGRLSLSTGFGKFAPMQATAELFKALVGLAAVTVVCYALVRELIAQAPGLASLTPINIAIYAWGQLRGLLWRASLTLALLAGADYGLQYWRWYSQVKMTRQEVKDEFRANDGNPEIKARVRRVQREMTRRRMLHAVKTATVVITNPTHFAVALTYRRGEMAAPMVVAKGQDLMAARIRKVAAQHGVPTVENVTLARALYKSAEIGDAIPGDLFGAVAEVLAYLVRLKQIVL